MLDLFRILKIDYKEYLILFKSGSFYVGFDEDAVILNKLYDYKLNELKNNVKVGFPINSIQKVKKKLEDAKINYLIVENKNIVDKYNTKKNNFKKYSSNVYQIISIRNRINNISKRLNGISMEKDKNITKLLEKIEDLVNE